MQGIAFQGAFFAASPLMEEKELTEEALLEAIRGQLQRKFGDKGARVVRENLEVVRRGRAQALSRGELEGVFGDYLAEVRKLVRLTDAL